MATDIYTQGSILIKQTMTRIMYNALISANEKGLHVKQCRSIHANATNTIASQNSFQFNYVFEIGDTYLCPCLNRHKKL